MSDEAVIYLVRHPETVWNAEGRCQGRGDSAFSESGATQLRALVDALRDVPFDAAYTSTLPRARRTAEAVLAAHRGMRAAGVPELEELDYGDLQGSRFADWPSDLHDRWRSDPWSVAFPNGESLADLRTRVVGIFRRIVAAHPGETVLVSSHGHVNRILLLEIEGVPRDFWSIDQPNGGARMLTVAGAAR